MGTGGHGLGELLREEYHGLLGEVLEKRGGDLVSLCEHLLKGGRGEQAKQYLVPALDQLIHRGLTTPALELAQQAGWRPKPPQDNEPKTSWIEIALVDEADQPIPGERYELRLPDGKIRIRVLATVTSVDFEQATLRSGYFVPAMTSRQINTFIDIAPAQGFALTGLVNEQVMRQFARIPELAQTRMIQTFEDAKGRRPDSNLLVLFTPTVIEPPAD